MKLLIADDHAILRAGLKLIVGELKEISYVGEAEDSTAVMRLLREEDWDVLLLDLDMPGPNVLEMLKRAKLVRPELAVLILSMLPEEQFALRALKAGATGYLSKSSAPENLLAAIRIVAGGGTYISGALASALVQAMHAKPIDTINSLLSDREFEVLRGLSMGQSIVNISQKLNLSSKTVSTYRTRILSKLHLGNNVELARFAVEHGLIK